MEITLVLVFSAHLLCMNVAAAGPVVCLWLKRRERKLHDEAAGELGFWLAKLSLRGVLAGTALGLAALGLLHLFDGGAYWQALWNIPARRIWFGLIELLFFAAGLAVYVRAWKTWSRRRPMLHAFLGILIAGNLIYHFPVLFAAVTVVSTQERSTAGQLDYASLLSLFGDGQTLARTAHFLLASAAVAGVAMIAYSTKAPLSDPDSQRIAAWGGRLAFASSLLQIPGGTTLMFSLPGAQYDRLLGGDFWAAGLFAVSLFATLSMLHLLAVVAIGASEQRQRTRTVGLMIVVVVFMTGARQRAGWERGRAVGAPPVAEELRP